MQLEYLSKDFTSPISVYRHAHRVVLVRLYMLDVYPHNSIGFVCARKKLTDHRTVGLRYVRRMRAIYLMSLYESD